MNIPDQFEVTIGPEDFRDATEYRDPFGCPLAIALKGKFIGAAISVSFSFAQIEGNYYRFGFSQWGDKISIAAINDYIEMAKDDISLYDIPTITLTLTKYEA
jgi:hypothetical protein